MNAFTAQIRCRGAMKSSRIPTFMTAFLATLLGVPVQAATDDIAIPPVPLQMGPRPVPNLMFILDTSGWMPRDRVLNPEFPRMPGYPYTPETLRTPEDIGGRRVWISDGDALRGMQDHNLLAYSPRITYQPWMLANGTLAPAALPQAAYEHSTLTVLHPDKPGGAVSPAPGVSTVNLQSGERLFYVSRLGLASWQMSDPQNYTLYKLKSASEAQRCIVARKDARGYWNQEPLCEPTTQFSWDTPNGTVVRSLAEEWQNYANWYAYHRTRMKVLKAGASHAFGKAGTELRVGFWDSSRGYPSWAIPVRSADGRFKDDEDAGIYNRTRWFQQLYQADTNLGIGTSLHRALQIIGDHYFTRKDEDGPWAPLPGNAIGQNHIACRRNLAVLATDGQWTDRGDGYRPVGNADGAAGPPFQDGYADTLADLAYALWKKDLRPDLNDVVPPSSSDPAIWQHLTTHAISVVPRGNLRASDVGRTNWPNPNIPFPANVNLLPEKVDDLRHAAVNGRGRFAPATRVDEFVEALAEALSDTAVVNGSASNLAIDGASVRDASLSYVASFKSGEWSGDVRAYAIGAEGPGKQVWSAARGIPVDSSLRTVLTRGAENGGLPAAFPTQDQQSALTTEVADYLRGKRDQEGKRFRSRASLMGDVVNSSPVYLDAAGQPTIFVGANDGMLHAIDAITGKERFSYVPALLDMATLKEYSRPLGFKHRYYVDGPLAISSRQQTPGKSLLIGTLGRGGPGVFGLDVTQPGSFAVSGRAWEYADDEDMGMVVSSPRIARIRGKGGVASAGVLVPNGLNSPNGKAVLIVLDAETGKLLGKVPTNAETGNGLSTPTVLDTNGDGYADRAYAGDLRGNVWRFDIGGDPGKWKATRVFTAVSDQGARQPITGNIGVAYHPGTLRPWVLFGTGRYLSDTDPFNQSLQSWYGVEDGETPANREDLKLRKPIKAYVSYLENGREVTRAFESARPGDMQGKRGWVLDLMPGPSPDSSLGAYPEGERMIGDQLVMGGNVLVAASMVPDIRSCTSGKGVLNFIEAFTGGAVRRNFLDVNGDGMFDGRDELLLPGKQGSQSPGSLDLGIGMVTDPAVLLGDLAQAGKLEGLSMFCANGMTGKTGCVKFSWGPGSGRAAWWERYSN